MRWGENQLSPEDPMQRTRMKLLAGVFLGTCLVVGSEASAQVSSTTKERNDVDCGGLALVSASGVPSGPIRGYKFHGTCKILEVYSTTKKLVGYTYDQSADASVLGTVWADLAATWDSKTGWFKEDMKTTQGPYPGQISMELRCAGDPVLTGVTCSGVNYSNSTGWDGFDGAYAIPRPISRGKTTLAQATALSQQQTANTPPSLPPDPTPAPTIQRAAVPSGTEPVVAVPSPQIVVQRTTPVPSPGPPPPPSSGRTEIPLAPAVRLDLQDGRAIVAEEDHKTTRWAIIDHKGQLLRRFPAGSRLLESSSHDLTIEWHGGSYRAGHGRPGHSLPASKRKR
jgi:hypothetical protein